MDQVSQQTSKQPKQTENVAQRRIPPYNSTYLWHGFLAMDGYDPRPNRCLCKTRRTVAASGRRSEERRTLSSACREWYYSTSCCCGLLQAAPLWTAASCCSHCCSSGPSCSRQTSTARLPFDDDDDDEANCLSPLDSMPWWAVTHFRVDLVSSSMYCSAYLMRCRSHLHMQTKQELNHA